MNALTLFLFFSPINFYPMKKLLLNLLFIFCTLTVASPQEAVSAGLSGSEKVPRNLFKFNVSSAVIKNYSLQYERVLSRSISLAIGYRTMPESGLPYPDKIINWFDITDPEPIDLINNVNLSNYAITPEIRFYTGKKRYGRGFYLALFYRYGHYEFNNAVIKYEPDIEDDIKADEIKITAEGNVTSHTGGFMLGTQWALGKHVCLDWWILGPHFGISSGKAEGISSTVLSQEDQQNIKDELNDIDIPMFKQTVDVSANKVSMSFDGPWAGVRGGLSLGIKF
jgi:hypothetical protein